MPNAEKQKREQNPPASSEENESSVNQLNKVIPFSFPKLSMLHSVKNKSAIKPPNALRFLLVL